MGARFGWGGAGGWLRSSVDGDVLGAAGGFSDVLSWTWTEGLGGGLAVVVVLELRLGVGLLGGVTRVGSRPAVLVA